MDNDHYSSEELSWSANRKKKLVVVKRKEENNNALSYKRIYLFPGISTSTCSQYTFKLSLPVVEM